MPRPRGGVVLSTTRQQSLHRLIAAMQTLPSHPRRRQRRPHCAELPRSRMVPRAGIDRLCLHDLQGRDPAFHRGRPTTAPRSAPARKGLVALLTTLSPGALDLWPRLTRGCPFGTSVLGLTTHTAAFEPECHCRNPLAPPR
ncbi:hypothetical protein EJ04DRAFT_159319 [Polyplosphaeria fusca]|uniref:Uncharacterized protein n=1 Tax=Polyplosphaeria fusca TaxID=682080 RepID=A0A9P4QZD1_9PLEO|nr:hypothetical protein EJ04DRAFT_159319 [Polyplosphaeria fusca]